MTKSRNGTILTVNGFATGDCAATSHDIYLDDWKISPGYTNHPCAPCGPRCVVTCQYPVDVNTACMSNGPHALRLDATCDKNPDANGNCTIRYSQTVNDSFSLDYHAKITSIEYTPDAFGNGTAFIGYEYPNTNDSQQRVLSYWIDNENPKTYWALQYETGTLPEPLSVTCRKTGTYQFYAEARQCNGTTDKKSKAISVKTDPTVSLSYDEKTNEAVVTYNFPNTASYSQRELKLEWLPSITNPSGSHIKTITPVDMAGTWRHPIGCLINAQELIRATATACGHTTVHSKPVVIKKCDGSCSSKCSDCAGDPIRTTNGNMRYSERDPLPGDASISLTRVYDSTNTRNGTFGRGWTSVFDSWLRSVGGTDGRDLVVIGSEDNDRYVFLRTGGAYVQEWPITDAPPTRLTYDSLNGTFIHDTHQGFTRTYRASDGKLVKLSSDSSTYSLDISYDAAGLPTRVADSHGRWAWTITVDAVNSRVTTISVEGRADLAWTYSYRADGNLETVTPQGSPAWRTYSYSSSGMTDVRDANGNSIESHTYDVQGRANSSIGPSGELTNFEYDLPGRVASETLTRTTAKSGAKTDYYSRHIGGKMRTVEVSGPCSCGTDSIIYGYDNEGRTIREQDARGYLTLRTFDPTGRLTSESRANKPVGCDPVTDVNRCRLDPDAILTQAVEATSATRTTTYSYGDPIWREKATQISVNSVLQPGGSRVENYVYDATTGKVLSHTVTGYTGNPATLQTRTTTTVLYDGTASAAFDPGGAFNSAWLSLPQPKGEIRSIDGPRGDVSDVTLFVYYPLDASVTATWRGRLAAVKAAVGHITRYENYDVFGNATRTVDANGVASESTFDALGRVLTTTVKGVAGCDTASDPLCAKDLTTTRTYTPASGSLSAVVTPAGGATTFEYDTRGRTKSLSRGPNTADLRERKATAYDPNTGGVSQDQLLQNQSGSWVQKHTISYEYDAFGQLRATVNADNTRAEYDYDSMRNRISIKDERHTAPNVFHSYDPAGRLTEVRQKQVLTSGPDIVTRYAYDLHDNLSSVTDPNGNVTAYTYDDFGQLIRTVSPVTGTTTNVYDAAGNLTSTTDANSATTTRTYDSAGRLLSSTSSRSGSSSETVTWTYDTGLFGKGRIATMNDPSGMTSYEYERRGLVRRENRTILGNSFATSFRYDANGNRTAITYPSGAVVNYTFDFADRPYSATSGSTTYVSSASYLPFGPETNLGLGNGATIQRAYDSRYRMTENKLVGPAPIASYTYTHDGVGNITQLNDTIDANYNRTFTYDDLSRLKTANTGSSLWGSGSYSYDAMGNMINLNVRRTASFTYAGATARVSTATDDAATEDVTHDAVGNELAVGFTASENKYSPRNLLVAADGFSYTYDGRSVRVSTTVADDPVVSLITPEWIEGGGTGEGFACCLGVIALDSSNSAIARPKTRSLNTLSGSSFAIATTAVSARHDVTFYASYGPSTWSQITSIIPVQIHISSVVLDPSSVVAGNTSTGTVTIDQIAPAGGLVVQLTSSNTTIATVPSSITIPAGATSGTFPVTTTIVEANTSVTITGRYNYSIGVGYSSRAATLTVAPPPHELASITVSPVSVIRGWTSTGTATLNRLAPAGGAVVSLSSSDTTTATVPTNVTIAEGSKTATFTITTSRNITVDRTATISGTYAVTRSAILTVTSCTPPTAAAPSLGSETVWFDDTPPNGVTLTGTWTWDTGQKASGTKSHTDGYAAGLHEHGFHSAPNNGSLSVTATDQLVTYVLLDPCDPPREILLEWRVGSDAEHRAFWGEDLITVGTLGTASRIAMGALPPLGQWVRLAVSAEALGLAGAKITGMTFKTFDGRAWFDRSAKGSCTVPTASAPTPPGTDRVWIEDALPAGATSSGTWVWDSVQKVTGTKSNTEAVKAGDHAHSFTGATTTMSVSTGEKLIAYVLVSSCDPPRQIMVEWYDGTWEHRAFWGENLINVGTLGTVSRRSMGALPAAGQWVRLEVPASAVGLEGRTVTGMSFRLYNGKAWFDHIGAAPSSGGAWEADPISAGVTAEFANFPVTPTAAVGERRFSIYSPELQLLAETIVAASSTAIQYEYIWFGGRPVAQVEYHSPTVSEVDWTFTDHLGTPILLTDFGPNVTWRAEYEPFGQIVVLRAGEFKHQPLRFPGQEAEQFDDEFTTWVPPNGHTDRSYNIFRWYRSGWGRYTQTDPVGLRAGTNLFGYALGNPLRVTDRFGLFAQLLCRQVTATGLTGIQKWIVDTYEPLHCRLRVRCGVKCPQNPDFFDITVGRENTNPAGSPGIYELVDDTFSKTNYSGPWKSYPVDGTGPNCEFEKCVKKIYETQKGNSGLVPKYNATGPNSNTFINNLITQCGGHAQWPDKAYGNDWPD